MTVSLEPDRPLIATLRRRARADLAYLRRFGRAVTGDQKIADTAVIRLLEDMLEAPEQTMAGREPRVAIFRRLRVILGSFCPPVSGPGAIGRTPIATQAMLLSVVEGFNRDDVASILDVPSDEVENLVRLSREKSLGYGKARILIIEDEPLISLQLETIAAELGHNVVATAVTQAQAMLRASPNFANLILSDVLLADGSSGIDAVNDIHRIHHAPVIFITAFPERLLTGERPEPTFLITKPFDGEAVKATISQALFLNMAQSLSGKQVADTCAL